MNIQNWIEAGNPWNVILHGDCMDLMKQIPDKFIDLAITDPPYGINAFKNLKVNNNRIQKVFQKSENFNNSIPDENYFDELFRISKNQIIWGANNFMLPPSEYFCIWNKKQTVDNFASAEYAWVSMGLKKPAKVFEYSIHKHNQINKIHPTEKPVALYRWLLQNYAKPGDKILDTHVGSGSSLIACWEEGFEYCGFEIDEDYYNAACNRLEQVQAQGKLFATV